MRIWVVMAFLLASAVLPTQAQTTKEMDMMALGDQPGYVPNPTEEQLGLVYQRQPVYFRTTEQPGTIVVHTSERFLYLIQGNNRAIRYGVGSDAMGFAGPEFTASRARPNGRTGRRRRR
jgi:lipoprotein-anchoring transpeptidase ErfK/SrfK